MKPKIRLRYNYRAGMWRPVTHEDARRVIIGGMKLWWAKRVDELMLAELEKERERIVSAPAPTPYEPPRRSWRDNLPPHLRGGYGGRGWN